MTDAPASAERTVSPHSARILVFVVLFVDLLGFGIVLPLLPVSGDEYVTALISGEDAAKNLAILDVDKQAAKMWSGVVVGLLMASFSFMQFLFAPVWGRLSDRVGRRPIILVGLVGSVVFYTLFGYAAGLPADPATAGTALALLFITRCGAGIAGATIGTAQAVIADVTPPEQRKTGMALIGAAFGIAFTFGPLLGALAIWLAPTTRTATSYTGYTAALLSLIALVFAYTKLPETRRLGAPPVERKWLDLSAWKFVLGSSAIAPVVLTFFLATIGFASFEVTLSLLNKDALELDKRHSYLLFAYVGFVLLLSQGYLYRKLAKKGITEPTFMFFGIILMASGVAALGTVNLLAIKGSGVDALGADNLLEIKSNFGLRLTLALVALAVAVVGFSFLTPSAQALVSRRTPADRQGEILGVNQSAAALARILGPIFGLSLYKLTPTHLLPYLFGAGLLLLMLPMIPRIRRG